MLAEDAFTLISEGKQEGTVCFTDDPAAVDKQNRVFFGVFEKSLGVVSSRHNGCLLNKYKNISIRLPFCPLRGLSPFRFNRSCPILRCYFIHSKIVTIPYDEKQKKSGETLSGATVGFLEHPGGIVTNSYGFYSITIPEGKYSMIISYSGYATDTIVLDLKQNTVINKMMSAGNTQLKEVVVAARKGSNNILKTPPGLQRLSMEDIQNVPVLLGEKDVLKTIQMLPGIKSAGDGKSGFYVRGGGADQNLIVLDEATVYNPSHLLSFFSVFNSDAIKDISVYKGGMPSNYGGPLPSFEDIKIRDGNDQKFGVSGGIRLIASRLK